MQGNSTQLAGGSVLIDGGAGGLGPAFAAGYGTSEWRSQSTADGLRF